jgi:hypothetical protein
MNIAFNNVLIFVSLVLFNVVELSYLMSMTMSSRNQKAEVPRMILIVRALTRHIVLRLGQGVGVTTDRLWKGKRGATGLRRP